MSTPMSDPLDAALAILKATIDKQPTKRRDILIKWLVKWSRYLSLEDTFKPECGRITNNTHSERESHFNAPLTRYNRACSIFMRSAAPCREMKSRLNRK